jgi:uncharacterized protein Yka (UPF0111/DUF47 family)
MSAQSNSVVSRLVDRVFPVMPDFYGLVNEQCDLAVNAITVFVEYMETADQDKASQVRELEKQGDALKTRNTDILNRAFATPIDREDLFRAITAIDHVINYAKTTVRELEIFELEPDPNTLEMAIQLKHGTQALQSGFKKLSQDPAAAEADAQAARKAERNMEKLYRRALAGLFNEENCMRTLEAQADRIEISTMKCILNVLKQREIYRHLSNAGDRVARAGGVLHDIVVKIS